MAKYNVTCRDGREFELYARDAESAKTRVECITWGRVPRNEMSVRRA